MILVGGAEDPSDSDCVGFVRAETCPPEYLEELSELQVLCSLPFDSFSFKISIFFFLLY